VKPKITSGASYETHNPWAAEDDSDEDNPSVQAMDAAQGAKVDFKRAWSKWARLDMNWQDLFPEVKSSGLEGKYDLVHDLMPLPVGKVYQKIIESDPQHKVYGYLPQMAGCSKGQIGALNAESFCERVLSGANLVVTDGNTLLKDTSVTKLTILRINREFMEYMRANYNAASRQKFKTTVVDEAA
jgi:hypothetical protein